jgi:hypothetical protein
VKIFAKPTQPLALRDWIGIFLITAFISVLFALMFKNIPKANEQLIVYMLGQLSGFVATIVGYHYVTSVGDTAKTENTGKLADAMKAVAQGVSSGSDAGKAAGEVADAAAEKAGEIQEERP